MLNSLKQRETRETQVGAGTEAAYPPAPLSEDNSSQRIHGGRESANSVNGPFLGHGNAHQSMSTVSYEGLVAGGTAGSVGSITSKKAAPRVRDYEQREMFEMKVAGGGVGGPGVQGMNDVHELEATRGQSRRVLSHHGSATGLLSFGSIAQLQGMVGDMMGTSRRDGLGITSSARPSSHIAAGNLSAYPSMKPNANVATNVGVMGKDTSNPHSKRYSSTAKEMQGFSINTINTIIGGGPGATNGTSTGAHHSNERGLSVAPGGYGLAPLHTHGHQTTNNVMTPRMRDSTGLAAAPGSSAEGDIETGAVGGSIHSATIHASTLAQAQVPGLQGAIPSAIAPGYSPSVRGSPRLPPLSSIKLAGSPEKRKSSLNKAVSSAHRPSSSMIELQKNFRESIKLRQQSVDLQEGDEAGLEGRMDGFAAKGDLGAPEQVQASGSSVDDPSDGSASSPSQSLTSPSAHGMGLLAGVPRKSSMKNTNTHSPTNTSTNGVGASVKFLVEK
jgi:hypothetical protein